jgi:hypothetical protein
VIPQVARCWEGSRTEGALVWLLLIVNHSVIVEIGACRELLLAALESAFERFLSCVNSERKLGSELKP